MKEKFWLVTSFVLGTLLLVSLFAVWQGDSSALPARSEQASATKSPTKPVALSQLQAEPQPFDWGEIKINGGIVQKEFKIKNEGESVKTERLETSCMCTEASLNGSPFFGMPGHQANPGFTTEINKGQEVTLTVRFDPAAHGPEGLGKVDRVIRIWFSRPENSYKDIEFTANVVK